MPRQKQGKRITYKRKLFFRGKIRPFYAGYGALQNLLINILKKRVRVKRKTTQSKTNITRLKNVSPRTTTGAAARPRRGLSERGKLAADQVRMYKARGWIKIRGGAKTSPKLLPGINIASGRKWRGPPGALGDDVIVEILPTVEMAIEAGRPGTLQKMNVKVDWAVTWNAINDFYTAIVKVMKETIGRPYPRMAGMVPTDTGTLRRKMWQSIERQWYSKTKMPMTPGQMKKAAEAGDPLLIIVLNTGNLMYAKPVNQMPTRMLAHPHAGSRNIGRGGPLSDPNAVSDWWTTIKTMGRNAAHMHTPYLRARTGQKLLEIHYS